MKAMTMFKKTMTEKILLELNKSRKPKSVAQIRRACDSTWSYSRKVVTDLGKEGLIVVTKKGREMQIIISEKGKGVTEHIIEIQNILKGGLKDE